MSIARQQDNRSQEHESLRVRVLRHLHSAVDEQVENLTVGDLEELTDRLEQIETPVTTCDKAQLVHALGGSEYSETERLELEY